jgi:citrate lyase alpha subunit
VTKEETTFPLQADNASCAVYCVLYAKVVTSMLEYDNCFTVDAITTRNEIARGLVTGKLDWAFLGLSTRSYLGVVVEPPAMPKYTWGLTTNYS